MGVYRHEPLRQRHQAPAAGAAGSRPPAAPKGGLQEPGLPSARQSPRSGTCVWAKGWARSMIKRRLMVLEVGGMIEAEGLGLPNILGQQCQQHLPIPAEILLSPPPSPHPAALPRRPRFHNPPALPCCRHTRRRRGAALRQTETGRAARSESPLGAKPLPLARTLCLLPLEGIAGVLNHPVPLTQGGLLFASYVGVDRQTNACQHATSCRM